MPIAEMTECYSDALGCFGKYRATIPTASSAFPCLCQASWRSTLSYSSIACPHAQPIPSSPTVHKASVSSVVSSRSSYTVRLSIFFAQTLSLTPNNLSTILNIPFCSVSHIIVLDPIPPLPLNLCHPSASNISI